MAGGNGRYTHRSLPPPWLSPTRPPMQNHPLSRSMGNYFLSVDYGVNFRTTRPDHFERDTAPVRDIVEKENRNQRRGLFSRLLPFSSLIN